MALRLYAKLPAWIPAIVILNLLLVAAATSLEARVADPHDGGVDAGKTSSHVYSCRFSSRPASEPNASVEITPCPGHTDHHDCASCSQVSVALPCGVAAPSTPFSTEHSIRYLVHRFRSLAEAPVPRPPIPLRT